MGFAAIPQAGIWAPFSSWMARREGEKQPFGGDSTIPEKPSALLLLPRSKDRSLARGFVAASPPSDLATVRQHRAPTLRVVRVVDGRQNAQCAGRMLISGRMADVCAELDRLAP